MPPLLRIGTKVRTIDRGARVHGRVPDKPEAIGTIQDHHRPFGRQFKDRTPPYYVIFENGESAWYGAEEVERLQRRNSKHAHATKKTPAQLDAEVRKVLLQPISQGTTAPRESLREFAERVGRESKSRQKRLHQALLRYPALLVTDRRGRQTLLISSGEMSNPAEGAHRVTMLLPDGPQGHITRKSITRLAQDLSRDLAPERIEPLDEEAVMAWVSTPEYVEGSERVLEMQRRNRQ